MLIKSTHKHTKVAKTRPLRTAILYPAVWISNSMNKTGICCKLQEPIIFCSSFVKSEQRWLRPEKLKLEALKKKNKKEEKKKSTCINLIEPQTESGKWKYSQIFCVFMPTSVFGSVPFNRVCLKHRPAVGHKLLCSINQACMDPFLRLALGEQCAWNSRQAISKPQTVVFIKHAWNPCSD